MKRRLTEEHKRKISIALKRKKRKRLNNLKNIGLHIGSIEDDEDISKIEKTHRKESVKSSILVGLGASAIGLAMNRKNIKPNLAEAEYFRKGKMQGVWNTLAMDTISKFDNLEKSSKLGNLDLKALPGTKIDKNFKPDTSKAYLLKIKKIGNSAKLKYKIAERTSKAVAPMVGLANAATGPFNDPGKMGVKLTMIGGVASYLALNKTQKEVDRIKKKKRKRIRGEGL